LSYLQDEQVVHHAGGQWHWMSESFPANEISLRSASSENFVIVDTPIPTTGSSGKPTASRP